MSKIAEIRTKAPGFKKIKRGKRRTRGFEIYLCLHKSSERVNLLLKKKKAVKKKPAHSVSSVNSYDFILLVVWWRTLICGDLCLTSTSWKKRFSVDRWFSSKFTSGGLGIVTLLLGPDHDWTTSNRKVVRLCVFWHSQGDFFNFLFSGWLQRNKVTKSPSPSKHTHKLWRVLEQPAAGGVYATFTPTAFKSNTCQTQSRFYYLDNR